MKLPIHDNGQWITDADNKTVFSCGISDFNTDEDREHRAQCVRAVNHHDALVAALEKALSWAAQPEVMRGELSPMYSGWQEDFATALAAAKGEAQ